MKQNWLLTGVCVGSVIMAIAGWTRHPDCNCPKDLNATIESTVAKPAAGVTLGAREGGDDGQAAVLGRPRGVAASTGAGQSAPVTTTIANARGPLGQPAVAGNGGTGAGSGAPFDGTSGAGGPLGGWRGGGAPGGGTNTGVELGKPAFPNGTGASASSGTSSTSSTTGGSQTTSSTSGGTVATSSSSSSSSTTGGSSSTSGGTETGKPKPDDFGPRDPNGKPHKKGGPDDFGPHRDGDAGGASGGKGKPAGGSKPEHKPDGDHKKDDAKKDGGSWRDRFGNGGGRPSDDPKPAVEVPEPGTFGLAGVGLAGIAFARYRRRKARALPPSDTPPEA